MSYDYLADRKRSLEERKQRNRQARERWQNMTDDEREQHRKKSWEVIDRVNDLAKNFLETNVSVSAVKISGNSGWQGQFKCRHCPKVFIFNEWGRYLTQALNRMSNHLKTAHNIKTPIIYPSDIVEHFVNRRVDPVIYGKKEYCNHCGKEQYVAQAYKHNIPVVVCRECNTIIRNGMK